MSYIVLLLILLCCNSVLSRNVLRIEDLDEEDQLLFRAAYDTPSYGPSYDHVDYPDDELEPGKIDLVKDGLWAVKAKIKELKAFDKALLANVLSTKLKLKDLLDNKKDVLGPLKKHHHKEHYDKKPIYNHQILPHVLVSPLPLESQPVYKNKQPDTQNNTILSNQNGQVISVRITSSVAVDKGKGKYRIYPEIEYDRTAIQNFTYSVTKSPILSETTKQIEMESTIVTDSILDPSQKASGDIADAEMADISLHISGANIEFIKQLNKRNNSTGALKEKQMLQYHQNSNETDDTQIAESSINSVIDIVDQDQEIEVDIPMARSVPYSRSSNNAIQDPNKRLYEKDSNVKMTTVSFNVIHNAPKFNENPSQSQVNFQQFFDSLPKVYSEPAKIYSEPAKFYSEPAKIYSEPAKVYSEPAKIYSEPAKFYSQPASLYLPPDYLPWHSQQQTATTGSTINTTPLTTYSVAELPTTKQRITEDHREKNYEVDEKISILTDGNSHGVQDSNTENCKHDNCKIGYVVEGRQYRKYRVEERTADGFIVGEYGVVRTVDGNLRGVRYTADSEASPRLIQDALMKFLQLR